MYKTNFIAFLLTAASVYLISLTANADQESTVFRRSNFSNEFNIYTPEGINARGFSKVRSENSNHHVKIRAQGLVPGEVYVILNHWYEPVPARGIPNSDDGPEDDPSCTGHFQFLGEPLVADKKGSISVNVVVNQLAPHIWVANFAKFLEVTNYGTQAPANADAFTTGGLLIPYADLLDLESEFIGTSPLTNCNI